MRELGIIPATPKSDDMSSLGIIPAQRASKSASGSNGYSPHNAAKSLVGDILNAREFQRGAKQGVTNVARGAYNLAQPALSHIPGLGKYINPMTEQQGQVLNPGEEKSGYAQLGKFAGEAGPIALGGEAAIPSLVARGIPKLAASAATYAGLAGATTPGSAKERAEQAGIGAASVLGGEALPYIGQGIKKGVQFTGKKLMKALVGAPAKGRTVEEIQEAIDLTPKGVKPSIADLAKAPRGQEIGKILETIPGSGAGRTGEEAADHFSETLKDIGIQKEGIKRSDIDPNEQLMGRLEEKYEGHVADTGKKYTKRDEFADKNNTPINLGKFDDSIAKLESKFSGTTISKAGKDLVGEAMDYVKDISGSIKSFSHATSQEAVLTDLINSTSTPEKGRANKIYTAAKKGLQEAMEESSKGDDTLYKLHKDAKAARVEQGEMERFPKKDGGKGRGKGKSELTPFFKSYLKGEESPDLINSMIKPAKSGGKGIRNSQFLAKHVKDKKILTDSLAARLGAQDASPQVIINRLDGFHNKQLKDFMGPEGAKKAQQLLDFERAFPKITSKSITPATGKLGAKAQMAVNAAKLAGAGVAAVHPGAAAIAAAPILGARALSNILRSPAARDLYLKELTGQSSEIARKAMSPTLRAALGAGIPAKTRQSNRGGQ